MFRAEVHNPVRVAFPQPDIHIKLFRGDQLVWEEKAAEPRPTPYHLLVTRRGEIITLSSGAVDELRVFNVQGQSRVAIGISSREASRSDLDAVFADDHVRASTAGLIWAAQSWMGLLGEEERYFRIRMSWGREVTLDLIDGRLVDPDDVVLQQNLAAWEANLALQGLSRQLATDGDWYAASVYLAPLLVQKVTDAVPLLREVERRCPFNGYAESCYALRGYRRHESGRGMAVLALRSLGAEPIGLPAYQFSDGQGETLAVKSRSEHAPFEAVSSDLGALEVLELLGSPDVASCMSMGPPDAVKRGRARMGERWIYLHGVRDNLRSHQILWNESGKMVESIERRIHDATESLHRLMMYDRL